jgi:hypothetical protein
MIERAGYQPIIRAWAFRPRENFVLRMQEAAAETDLTIAVLSEDYLKAEFTQPEWAAAFARDPTGKWEIPFERCTSAGFLTANLRRVACRRDAQSIAAFLQNPRTLDEVIEDRWQKRIRRQD